MTRKSSYTIRILERGQGLCVSENQTLSKVGTYCPALKREERQNTELYRYSKKKKIALILSLMLFDYL